MHDFWMTRIETPWGPWEAAPLGEVVALMQGLAVPWWVAGGYAIELAVGHAYREHGELFHPFMMCLAIRASGDRLQPRDDASGQQADDQDQRAALERLHGVEAQVPVLPHVLGAR